MKLVQYNEYFIRTVDIRASVDVVQSTHMCVCNVSGLINTNIQNMQITSVSFETLGI